MKINRLLPFSISLLFSASALASLTNPGFENQFSGWSDTDPSAISGDAASGSYSAKITGSSGRVDQQVALDTNTQYRLTAEVLGSGVIGINIGGTVHDERVNTSSWTTVTVEFDSGSASSGEVFAKYNDGTGRFDDFTLSVIGSSGGSGECVNGEAIDIVSASDDGTNDGHTPDLAIDGNLADSSRWSSLGDGKAITLDLGSVSTIDTIRTAWYKADERTAYFDVEVSEDGSNWSSVLTNTQSQGTEGFASNSFNEADARYVRIVGHGNSSNEWNSLIEVQVGCGDFADDTSTPPPASGSLDPNLAPSGNFDLSRWYLSVPTDTDNSGTADSIKENELNSGYEDSEYFYTGSDGGMVFKCPIDGFKTSTNTSYTRTELREMLRAGDTSIATQGVNKNNWVFGSAPSSDRNDAGGVDGNMTATLAVNHVTTTGSNSQVGRVIIGQIHANDDEPLRLYYRKLPGNSKGSIYFAHEPNGGSDSWYELIGSRSSSASDPSDGIALDEVFSYEIDVTYDTLTVTIYRDGKNPVSESVNMSSSGYSSGGQYMYFKAGVYNQNNSGNSDDYVQATFYSLEHTHD
nr:alginate lyase [Marinimicrobium sp.]